MRIIFTFLLLIPMFARAQGPQEPPSFEYANGSLEIPSLLSIILSQPGTQQLQLNKWSDFTSGKEYPGVCNVTIMSNVPWMMSVRAESPYFTPLSADAGDHVPVSLVEVKTDPGTYKTLSTNPEMLIQSTNNNIVNQYTVDMRLKRPFGLEGGQYTTDLRFIISAQ